MRDTDLKADRRGDVGQDVVAGEHRVPRLVDEDDMTLGMSGGGYGLQRSVLQRYVARRVPPDVGPLPFRRVVIFPQFRELSRPRPRAAPLLPFHPSPPPRTRRKGRPPQGGAPTDPQSESA